jgi:hypothetical protein
MNGGTISGNTANYGTVSVSSGGTFTMSGGTISGTTTTGYGGGVSASGGVRVDSGTFWLRGGTISDNTASGNGGGVHVGSGTFWMSGGTVHGRGAGAGLENRTGAGTGASLAIKDTAAIAKYGNFGDILESGLATDETLVGRE